MIATMTGCNSEHPKKEIAKTPFQSDLEFLQKHDSVIILKNGEGRVIASACKTSFLRVLPQFWWFRSELSSKRFRSSPKLALPYICRLIVLSLLIWPST